MPVQPTYPGVYIEEVPSGVRTIMGVSTSVTAFIGYTKRGPANKAVRVFNYGDYEREFGGLDRDSPTSYAVQHFFLNGGSDAYVVRVANGATKASVTLKNGVDASSKNVLTLTAKSEGRWGNSLRVDVDYDTIDPVNLFNLTVSELVELNGTLQVSRTETHRNLSMNPKDARYAIGFLSASSELVLATLHADAASAISSANTGESVSGSLSLSNIDALDDDRRRLAVTIDGDGPYEFDLFESLATSLKPTGTPTLTQLGTWVTGLIETAVQNKANPGAGVAFTQFTCASIISGSPETCTLTCKSGTENASSAVRITAAATKDIAGILKLGTANGGRETDAASRIRPAQTGSVGARKASLSLGVADAGLIKVDILKKEAAATPVTLATVASIDLWLTPPASMADVRDALASKLSEQALPPLGGAKVSLVDNSLRIVPGGSDAGVFLDISAVSGDTTATSIGLAGATDNIAAYALGKGATSQAQLAGTVGADGDSPGAGDIMGSRSAKTGIYSLEDVDLFNLLCLPDEAVSDAVLSEAEAYVEERRAFLLVDFPGTVGSRTEAISWLASNGSTVRHRNAAIYFPRIQLADPLQENRTETFPTCGAIAGLFARTDAARGVWKAPAGTEATLRGVRSLACVLSDPETGTLNPLGINCLRSFPVYGAVCWGSRTLEGADLQASEWKYIPVRRLALFLEESLYRGTQWVVFEPNDEPLWAQIRLNVGAFMHNLFRQGAFQGTSPKDAYFVKCDKETTTQSDINQGIVNILVGFAPLKPAEFVIIKISQIAGQIET